MRVTQTISIGTLRINSMSNSSIVQIGTSGAVKTRSEEITEVIPQAEANQQLEKKIYNTVKPHLAKEGIPTVQQPLGKTDTGWNGPEPEQKTKGSGAAPNGGITGSPEQTQQGSTGSGAVNGASNGAGNGYGVGIDSSSWYVDSNRHGNGRGRGGVSDAANRGKTRT